MTTGKNIKSSDQYLAYVASVMLALLTSAWLARLLVGQLVRFMPNLTDLAAQSLQVNIAAGLFFGISFANPVGLIIARYSGKIALALLLGGFCFGVVAQNLVFTPLAGDGLSNFVRLMAAATAVPLAMFVKQVSGFLAGRDIVVADKLASAVLRVARWPDRFLFILLMTISFLIFWRYTASTQQVLIALAGVLTVLTGVVATRKTQADETDGEHGADFQEWLDLQPEEEIVTTNLATDAIGEVKKLARTLLPGAILFGGMTRLAVNVLMSIYPNLQANLSDPSQMLKSLGIVAASGLGVVFFGMLVSLGFSLMLLQMIGRVRNWTRVHLRENCYHLLRTLYFRPMKRT